MLQLTSSFTVSDGADVMRSSKRDNTNKGKEVGGGRGGGVVVVYSRRRRQRGYGDDDSSI